ncbi:SDR family NAD(P)-dependent oxidoreductase [Leucobacter sp. G161]|uniref:SDR family NAD(P)-dependent oxidoreductase n=1 Tax=Leucobacter sp. G161 TaxID=663704 RepID=UPI00073CA843|nr:SDR family NAD(P)-dependent oxidoreductase [Leucobacter sp. G161]KUF06800.1 short-chain dehydrogenase [Leucobacter sp. G161]
MKRFAGKVALVTGGGGGIGSETCRRLASEGAHVYVADAVAEHAVTVAAGIREAGGEAQELVFDLTLAEACRAAVAEVEAASPSGAIDVLVNNAGAMRRGALLETSEPDWELSFAVNVDALFHMCRAVLPGMIAAGTGSIVNTASQWGLTPAPGHIAYNVTKAAVVSFTKSLARDYAPSNVRVNAVCPGEIHTPMLERGIAEKGKTIADLDAMVPLGRIGRPDEVAALIAFLASDEAEFVCGACVEITGAQAVA